MNEDSEKPNESKKERSRKRQRENSSKTDDESTDATFMEDQYGGQQNEDGTMNEETYGERLNEINMKLDKLLSLCPLVEDLNVQFASLKEENTQLRKSLQ